MYAILRLVRIHVLHPFDQLAQFLVKVFLKIREGDKERVQPFVGTVIGKRGGGARENFTVRRIVEGEGVERVFPLHSPNVVGVRVRHRGEVRRAKLFYLRERTGKATRIKGRVVHDAELRREEDAARAAAKAAAAAAKSQEEKPKK